MGTPLTKTIPQNTSFIQNGIRVDTNNVSNNMGFGVQQPVLCTYNLVPLAPTVDLISLANTGSNNTAVTLNSRAVTTGLGGQGVTLDCQRAVSIYFPASANTLTTPASATCNGYDDRGVPVTASVTIPTTDPTTSAPWASGAAVTFPKMFSRVTSVVWNSAPVSTTGPAALAMSIGTGSTVNAMKRIVAAAYGVVTNLATVQTGVDAFGLPFFCPYRHYILGNPFWGNQVVTDAATPITAAFFQLQIDLIATGTIGGFVPGYQMNPLIRLSDGTTNGGPAAPSATTQDARGYIYVPTAANGPRTTAPTETQLYGAPTFSTADAAYPNYNMLSVSYYQYGADSYVQSQLTNGNASVQMQTLIFGPTTPAIGYGSTTPSSQPSQLLDRDEVGLQNSTPGV